jgi:uncharacterized membrane protein YjgN (DUF898 family)
MDRQELPFQFTGSGSEYFRIWIVNICLTLITLGIYSAWAKVRSQRYFYGNTRLEGHAFEYLASPVAILKGRVATLFLLGTYLLSQQFLPELALALFALFVLVMPWLICRALAFRRHSSRYRSIRFRFVGTYLQALKAYVMWPVLAALTLGLLFPYAVYRQKRFLVANSHYGSQPFEARFGPGDFYRIYLTVMGMALIALLSLVFMAIAPAVGLLAPLVLYLLIVAYISANTANRVYGGAVMAGHCFRCNQSWLELAGIYLTNFLLILVTLGLAIPWARVRLAKYRADHLVLLPGADLNGFLAVEAERVAALGEELGEVIDLDIGF